MYSLLDGDCRIIPSSCKSRVTALLTLSADQCGRDYPVVIWGAGDYSVRVHNLRSGKELACFRNHAGDIQSLVSPYVYSHKRSASSNCFCSVGADNNVVMYSLAHMDWSGFSRNVETLCGRKTPELFGCPFLCCGFPPPIVCTSLVDTPLHCCNCTGD